MSRNSLGLSGVLELQDALRRLPDEVVADGDRIVGATADGAAEAIREGYPVGPAGTLKNRVSVSKSASRGGMVATVRSADPIASIFENGTAVRHDALGHNRGRMPPGRVFIPIVETARREMHDELIDLVRTAGFEVTDAVD